MTSASVEGRKFRAVLTWVCWLQALAVLVQGTLAGGFLSGMDSAVRQHEIGGWVTFSLALVQVGMVFFRPADVYGLWLRISSVTMVLADSLQLGSGYGRFSQVHIPLAVLIVGGLTWQILWIAQNRTTTE